MKKNILILVFGIFSTCLLAQNQQRVDVSVYPNPASHYIEINNEAAVRQINIINLAGRKMRTFEVYHDDRYDISDLPNGMYLVQIVGKNNRVLTTQRLNKRS
jgi:hypothetical protein